MASRVAPRRAANRPGPSADKRDQSASGHDYEPATSQFN